MSHCVAEDPEVVKKFPAVYQTPKFLEDLEDPTPAKERADGPTPANEQVLAELQNHLDTTIFRLLVTAKSTREFGELRDEVFNDYIEVSGTIATILRIAHGAPSDDESVANAAFAGLRRFLDSDTQLLVRHEGAKDEALFCLDTLRRAHFMVQDAGRYISKGTPSSETKASFQDAIVQEWWSLLHLRCILFSIEHSIPPSDEVFGCLLMGFRRSVLAYAFAREAIEPKIESEYSQVDFEALAREEAREHSLTAGQRQES